MRNYDGDGLRLILSIPATKHAHFFCPCYQIGVDSAKASRTETGGPVYPFIGTAPSPVLGENLGHAVARNTCRCRWELEQRRMTSPSNFILRIIVEEDPKLVRTLNANYAGAAADGGLEPAERDTLFDVLGKHHTGQPWPRAGGMDATRRFMAKLQNAMIATRWKVDLLTMD